MHLSILLIGKKYAEMQVYSTLLIPLGSGYL
jgi:hypothetical protein